MYEGMLMFGVVFIAGYLFSTLSQTRHALDNRLPLQAFLFVVFGIYFTWFWSRGQTLAMKTWNIRLVDRNGQPVTQARAFARYLLSWLLAFAAPGCVGTLRPDRRGVGRHHSRLGGCLGDTEPLSPRTAVLA